MKLTPEHWAEYEQQNAFMAYNHIRICQASRTRSTVVVDLVPESRNLHGFAHGGLLYAMADCVTGLAARCEGGRFVTQSAHINFLRNVSEGTLYASATAVKLGRSLCIYHVSITDQNDMLLADGTVNLFHIPDSPSE